MLSLDYDSLLRTTTKLFLHPQLLMPSLFILDLVTRLGAMPAGTFNRDWMMILSSAGHLRMRVLRAYRKRCQVHR